MLIFRPCYSKLVPFKSTIGDKLPDELRRARMLTKDLRILAIGSELKSKEILAEKFYALDDVLAILSRHVQEFLARVANLRVVHVSILKVTRDVAGNHPALNAAYSTQTNLSSDSLKDLSTTTKVIYDDATKIGILFDELRANLVKEDAFKKDRDSLMVTDMLKKAQEKHADSHPDISNEDTLFMHGFRTLSACPSPDQSRPCRIRFSRHQPSWTLSVRRCIQDSSHRPK